MFSISKFIHCLRGYYPKGGGEVHLRIQPIKSLNAVNITNVGEPVGISGWSYVSGSVNINVRDIMNYRSRVALNLTRFRILFFYRSMDVGSAQDG